MSMELTDPKWQRMRLQDYGQIICTLSYTSKPQTDFISSKIGAGNLEAAKRKGGGDQAGEEAMGTGTEGREIKRGVGRESWELYAIMPMP